jgi:agmatinase
MGGLEINEVWQLIRTLKKAGKTIIGFDLNEVGYNAETDWNANVGARVLYKLCGFILAQ